MAYGLRNINVLDLKPSVGVGVQLPFSTAGVFQTVYTTQEQLKYNIINFLLTNHRERLYNPTYGGNIRAQLFQQITIATVDDIEAQITTGIQQYFPNVTVTSFKISTNLEENLITISFSYKINNTGESDNIIINING